MWNRRSTDRKHFYLCSAQFSKVFHRRACFQAPLSGSWSRETAARHSQLAGRHGMRDEYAAAAEAGGNGPVHVMVHVEPEPLPGEPRRRKDAKENRRFTAESRSTRREDRGVVPSLRPPRLCGDPMLFMASRMTLVARLERGSGLSWPLGGGV